MKLISDAKASFRRLMDSKTIGEFLDNLPWGAVEVFAFLAVAATFLSPINQFLANLFFYNDYAELIQSSHHLALIFGGLTIVLCTAKNIREKLSFTDFFRKNPFMAFFLPMTVFVFVSAAVNGFDYYTMNGIGDYNETMYTYLMYFSVYFFCASLITGTRLKGLLEYAFVITGIVIGCAALIHKYISPLEQFNHDIENADSIRAVFYHFNHYAYFLAMSVLLCASLFVLGDKLPLRLLSLAGFLLNSVVLVLNDTFGSYLAALFGLVFAVIVISLCRSRLSIPSIVMLGIFLIITVILSVFQTDTFSNFVEVTEDVGKIIENTEDSWLAGMGRWHLWRTIITFIKEKPLLGYGVDGCSTEFLKVGYDLRCHNEYLQSAAFFGIPAAVIYICGIMSVFLRGLKNRRTMDVFTISALIAAFGYCVCACTGNSKFYTAPIFFIMLGLAASGKKHK